MNGSFQYEWWTVDVLYTTGLACTEFKGKSKEHIIRQIEKWAANRNRKFNDTSLPWWERGCGVKEIRWDTLKLDRVGYQRLF